MTRTTRELLRVARDLKILGEWHRPPFHTYRQRIGHWQQLEGLWRVMLIDSEGQVVFGSQWSGREVIEAHKKGWTHAYITSRIQNQYSDVDVDCDHNKIPDEPRELERR